MFLWRGIKVRIRRMKCGMYVGSCSLCEEWKRPKAGRESNPRAR